MKTFKSLLLIAIMCLLIIATGAGSVFAFSSSEFYEWLEESGIPEHSVSGSYRANYGTYVKYNLVVYGSSGNVPGNEYKQGEYRYLGFTYLEGKYTNLDFPNDETGNQSPEQWNFVTVSGASESWDSLEQTVQRPYMIYTSLNGHGATGLTASDIGTSCAKVQSAASWSSSGSIYTYKSNGFYATFTVPSMGRGNLSASMTPDQSIIYVNEGDSDFNTGVNLSASVNKPSNEVAFIKVVFSCGNWSRVRYFHNTNSINIYQSADLDIPSSLPGSVSIKATVTSESIFGDKLADNISCSITVRRQTGGNTPIPTSIPNPTAPPYVSPPPSGPGPSYTPEPTAPPTTPPGGGDGGNWDGGGPGNNWNRIYILSTNLTGSWNHWDNQRHRFLALEKIKLRIVVRGRAKSAVIRLSPQLESMHYTNSSGHTYEYADDFFGYEVKFPEDSTLSPAGRGRLFTEFEWEYSLPMCDETIGWDGARKSQAYIIDITVYGKDGNSRHHSIDDVEVTGNIYELLYPQPL